MYEGIIRSIAKVDFRSVTRLAVYLVLLLIASVSAGKAQEREWTLDRTDQDVFLVFGTPETDDVGVSFWCRIGSKKVRLFLPVSAKATTPGSNLRIILSDQDFSLPVTINPNDNRDGKTLEAEFEVTSPLAMALPHSDYFTVVQFGTRRSFPLVNADTEGLIRLCTSPPVDP